jgi:hypothetical protein
VKIRLIRLIRVPLTRIFNQHFFTETAVFGKVSRHQLSHHLLMPFSSEGLISGSAIPSRSTGNPIPALMRLSNGDFHASTVEFFPIETDFCCSKVSTTTASSSGNLGSILADPIMTIV